MTPVRHHLWLPADAPAAPFRAMWVDSAGRVFVLCHWVAVWVVLLRVIADALWWLACWLTLTLAHGRGWGRPLQLRLWAA